MRIAIVTLVFPVCALLAACTDQSGPSDPSRPLVASRTVLPPSRETIPGSYLVVLRGDSTPNDASTSRLTDALVRKVTGRLLHRYMKVVHGFALDGVSAVDAQLLANSPAVAYVEPNAVTHTTDFQLSPGNGLDRIDQHTQPLDGTFYYQYQGAGTHIYVVDTGIDTTSGEWQGRIGLSTDCTGNGQPFVSNDDFGHGTAVASVAAGSRFGVAKQAIVHSVRISSDHGKGTSDYSTEVGCLDWIGQYGEKPAVVNLSWGDEPGSFAVRDAINCLIGCNGFSFVKSAGNDSTDAYQDRANRGTNEIVVGAMNPSNDGYASFSNYGSIITIFAPGVGVLVADKFNPGYGKLGYGTSFAAPYVAGVVATYVGYCVNSWAGAYCGPEVFFNKLHTNATLDQISGLPAGTSNYLLYSPFEPF